MADFWFVLKSFAASIAIMLLMQIRIGHSTIEQHSVAWMESSNIVYTLRDVVDGGFRVAGEAWSWLAHKTSNAFSGNSQRSERSVHMAHRTHSPKADSNTALDSEDSEDVD